jgi:formylglycine-generating enzyme required for sulfatase activity
MVHLQGGCFKMGDIFSDLPSSAKPVHEVCVDDFSIARYEVTVREFRAFVEETGYRTDAESQDGCHGWTRGGELEKRKEWNWRNPNFLQSENDPVVCVSWNDSQAYIKWLNEKEGSNYRLPTEAEWEYAARSRGKEHQYSWGNERPSGNIADETAKKELPGLEIWNGYNDGYPYTSPVGSFRPNELGIYDMSGNAYEWLEDWQGDDYYANSPKKNPTGPDTGKYKIIRGGAWDLLPERARTTHRYWNIPGGRAVCIGFRLAHPKKQFRIKN